MVDILLTGVTGFVGRYVLHALMEQNKPQSIAVIIRSSGKTTAQQRWAAEIVGSSLFAPWTDQLRSVRVIDAALENLETTTHQLDRVGTLIHCAANIKHYDPYEALERDNVGNVERILKFAESLHVQHLLLLSTCYAHPMRATARDSVRIEGLLKRSDFYNDYCYTKWRGEETVFAATTNIPNITIARLSCVGAPARWDLAAHPCAAQAHLGILSLALRGYLETLAWRPTARISTIPVDFVADALVGELGGREDEDGVGGGRIRILQLCAPPSVDAYHISLPLVISVLQSEFGLEDFRGLTRDDSRGDHLAWWKQVAYSCMTRGRQALTLHSHVQDFVSTFTDEDIRFQSSLDPAKFTATEQEVARETCAYAVRILHHRQLAKGVPMRRLDQFWYRLANREPVQICIRLEGVSAEAWPDYAQRIWTFFSGHRKCGAGVNNAPRPDRSLTWNQLVGHSLATYIAPPQRGFADEGRILAYGLQQPPERLWHCTPFLTTEGTYISHILLRMDHAVADGVGMFAHVPEFARRVLDAELRMETRPPRALGFWLDLWMGLVYVALLVVVVWSIPGHTEERRSKEPTVATGTGFVGPPTGATGRTFTTGLLWKLAQFFNTQQSSYLFAVPAVTSTHRPAKDMPTNAFVPVLLPVDSGMSEEAFAHRCMLLRAKSVRFLSWCLVQLLEWGTLDELRDLLVGKIHCVVSSLQAGPVPSVMPSIHVVTTTPTPVPYCITAITSGEKVFYTVRSHDPAVPAATLLATLESKFSHR